VIDPREKVGLKLLRALKREKDCGKTLLDCRSLSAVAAELRLSQSQFDRAIAFLIEKRAVNMVARHDGKATLPSPAGEALLAEKHEKKGWTFDRRLAVYPTIIALISLVLAVIGLSRCTQQ
jgi:hypothetical protein